jgi:dTMP kinase
MRGLMLAFEGLDKTGKTTQCKLLHNYLTTKGIRNRLIHFPVRNSVTGQVLNRYLTNELELLPQTSHLLFSSNRW